MKKSIYYLIATTIAFLTAWIFLGRYTGNTYPYFGMDLKVFATATYLEPLKYLVAIEALSIIYCAFDNVVLAKKSNPILSVLAGVVSVGTVFYALVSILLVVGNAKIGKAIELPVIFVSCFGASLVILLIAGLLAKKKASITNCLILLAVAVCYSGLFYQLFTETYVLVICIVVCVLILALTVILPKLLTKKAN